ncbi:MAG: hypothetical protein QOD92_1685 [Acidimicrobiaceae bacterium]
MNPLQRLKDGPIRRARTWFHDVPLRRLGLTGLVWRTGSFAHVRFLGHPIWQNPMDAWGIQEAIVEDDVDLIVECGTNRGGSAFYMASLFELRGKGKVITVDIESLSEVEHPRIEFVIGSSIDAEVVARVKARIAELQPQRVMVVLDSDHAGLHVLRELELYAEMVPIGGLVHVQDGCIDEIRLMRRDRPGPLWAIRKFVAKDARFEIDDERSRRYLFSLSPSGWLRRVA